MKLKHYDQVDDMLLEYGAMKKEHGSEYTWGDVQEAINEEFGINYSPSWYRKRYSKLDRSTTPQDVPLYADDNLNYRSKICVRENEKQVIRLKEEKRQMRKALTLEATIDALREDIAEQIANLPESFRLRTERRAALTANDMPERVPDERNRKHASKEDGHYVMAGEMEKAKFPGIHALANKNSKLGKCDKAIYAMLGDIHYGISFKHFNDSYSPEIAEERVMRYAEEIVKLGEKEEAAECYVTLMGDLISGMAHNTIRLENTKTMSEQVIGVSEIISRFLTRLAMEFDTVYVNYVEGNHSRVDQSSENSLRADRMDKLVPWYCEQRVSELENVLFLKNEYDPTIANFNIFGLEYVAVHGDFDKNKENSVNHISDLIGKKIDCFLTGHVHIPEMRADNTFFVRNGATVGGGDDYTAKNRMFGPASQVCLVVSPAGVDSVRVVRFPKVK